MENKPFFKKEKRDSGREKIDFERAGREELVDAQAADESDGIVEIVDGDEEDVHLLRRLARRGRRRRNGRWQGQQTDCSQQKTSHTCGGDLAVRNSGVRSCRL